MHVIQHYVMNPLLLTVCLSFSFVSAFIPHLPKTGYSFKREASINASDYPPLTVSIPVDHYNASDTRIYENRYWINSTYYMAGGPVFYFDSGEQNAHPLVPYFLAEVAGPSAVMTLARRYNGLAVLFEHRFYGDLTEGSFPFPMDAETGMPKDGYNAYKYLNTEQALQDPVYFAHNFEPPSLENYWPLLAPECTPWIWLGGSYPGIRGAQMRVRNPNTFFAAWASSAPTEAAVDMWTYFAQAERSMTRNCSADYTAVTNYVDSVLANGTASEIFQLKTELYTAVVSGPGHSPPVNETIVQALSAPDIAFYLLLPLSFYQYYGFQRSVLPFCDIMETQNRTTTLTTDNGGTAPALAYESGLASALNISAAWHAFLTALIETNYDAIPRHDNPIVEMSWTWQYCSEYGYYQVGNASNPHTIESRFISLEYFQSHCNDKFPYAPSSPNVAEPNKYGGWFINPSNTMFSSGEYDPWRALSPASTEENSPHRQTTNYIPPCGVSPPENEIFGIVYDGMVHVSDMRALLNSSDPNHQNFRTVGFSSPIDTEPFFAGVGLFEMALEQWLPCFGNGSYGRMEYVVGPGDADEL